MISFFRLALPASTMSWRFPVFLVATVTLPSLCLPFHPQPLEELSSDLGIQVFNQMVKSRPRDNIVISPHGIASVLGMLQLGAGGRTKLQLATMMKYNVNGACAALAAGLGGRGAASRGPLAGSSLPAPRSQRIRLEGFHWCHLGVMPVSSK